MPGSNLGGGLGQHSLILKKYYSDYRFWDFKGGDLNLKDNFFLCFVNRLRRRFSDSSFEKFERIDSESTVFLDRCKDPVDSILGFSGCCLNLFETAKKRGCKNLELESPTAHISHCFEMYQRAYEKNPIEKPWLTRQLRNKMLAEYNLADTIWVNSQYSFNSFVERGFPPSKLKRRFLVPNEDYLKIKKTSKYSDKFNIIYVGSLTITKGISFLVDTFTKIEGSNLRLRLVGGTSSRGMSRYLKQICKKDPRITYGPGDPRSIIPSADLLVHPSWSDGFGLAPMEALVAGVPVIVSEDTGMKEHVIPGKNGWVFPTGNLEVLHALLDSILAKKLNNN